MTTAITPIPATLVLTIAGKAALAAAGGPAVIIAVGIGAALIGGTCIATKIIAAKKVTQITGTN